MKLHLTYLAPIMALAVVVPDRADGEPPAGLTDLNVKAAAARIDRLLELDMKRAKISPNATANDATFARRSYLAIIGRIPTAAESLAFLNSQTPGKRGELIDRLLDSPGYDSHMFNFWADLLRVKTRLNNQVSGEPFIHYIKESIATKKPYDQFVREMLAAEGAAHARDNGATGLLMRDRGMPLDSMANTVRVFLGTRLECAQCHNHPFDKWKQKDFFQMAAFAGGINYRNTLQGVEGGDAIRRMYSELRRNRDRNGQRALGRMIRRVNTGLTGTGNGMIQLPKDYQYDDAKPGQDVKAHAIFGKTPTIKYKKPKAMPARPRYGRRMTPRQRANLERRRNSIRFPQVNSRTAYAEWLTSPKNPRFTRVIANRMWKQLMGRGLIEPVDNIVENTKASNEALLTYLEKLMIEVDYDLRQFQRVLFNTAAFQRDATKKEVPSDEKYYFQGPVLRRMTAEQVWDSMLTMVVPGVDDKLQKPGARASSVYNQYEQTLSMSEEDLRKRIGQEKMRYTDPQKYRAQQRARQRQQQEGRRRQQRAQQQKQTELRKRAQPIYRKLIQARRAEDKEKIASLKKKLLELGIDVDAQENRRRRAYMQRPGRRGRRGRNQLRLVRASDQQHPAPNGHFLRQFGQSDRDQIQASHTEANVPQVLSLLNGFVEQRILSNPSSVLMRSINSVSNGKEKVRRAYLGILNREPRGREAAVWAQDIDTQGESAVNDLVWTLINTHEFRFIK